jgi:hypothetical protein
MFTRCTKLLQPRKNHVGRISAFVSFNPLPQARRVGANSFTVFHVQPELILAGRFARCGLKRAVCSAVDRALYELIHFDQIFAHFEPSFYWTALHTLQF